MDLSIPKCCDFLHPSFPSWDSSLIVVAAPAAVCPALGAEHAAALAPSILSSISHILLENSSSSAGLTSPSLVWVQQKPPEVSFLLWQFTDIWTANGGTRFKEGELWCTLMNLTGWTVPLLVLEKIPWVEGQYVDHWGGEGVLGWAVESTCSRTSQVVLFSLCPFGARSAKE